MRKEIIYIAEDGKRFNNEKECQEYEEYNISFMKLSGVIFFDETGLKLEIPFFIPSLVIIKFNNNLILSDDIFELIL